MTDERMIHNKADLLEWIDGHPDRHQRVDEHACSCGWAAPVPWQEHFDAMLISDLGDVLPSETMGDDGPLPWRAVVTDLYECIDARDREERLGQ